MMLRLLTLPAEIQKAIITSLNYASLCMLRSSNRYFYNFLTESEIHAVFMNIEIDCIDSSIPIDMRGSCTGCVEYCDATESQIKSSAKKMKVAQKEVKRVDAKVQKAHQSVIDAWTAVKKAKAAVNKTQLQNEKSAKRLVAQKAEEKWKEAHKALKMCREEVAVAYTAKAMCTRTAIDLARTCSSYQCKRQHNGYLKPGVLDLSPQGPHAISAVCSRTSHYSRKLGYIGNLENMQTDGKICKICWKGTSRETAGKQRRLVFVEEYGYWMKWTWLEEGKAIKYKAEAVAGMTFEEIEAAQAINKIKKQVLDDKT